MSTEKVDKILQSAVGETANGAEFDISGYGAIAFQITGIVTATITFETTIDGDNWVSVQMANTASGVVATTATADGIYAGVIAGLQRVRARISAWTEGDITVTALATASSGGQVLADIDIAGSEVVTLGAGSATFGKLAANSGVDIGDVDVASLPSSIQGPGNPTIDSYNTAAINAAAAADQELVATPGANKQIWVYGCFMMADTGNGTVTFQDEDDTVLSGTMAVSDEGGWVLPPSGNFAMPWLKVATNKALEIDCATSTIDGIIAYAIVSV